MGRAYEQLRANEGTILIVADHASNVIPTHFNGLGLPRDILDTHIAIDIGTADLARALSHKLKTEALLSAVSRLVIDKNRRLDQEGLVPHVSDNIEISGNRGLSAAAIAERVEAYYTPYHAAVGAAVAQRKAPVLISLHSFTPEMDGVSRPWECGFLYNRDTRLASAAIAHFADRGLTVGDNEPYPGTHYNASMDRHAEAHGHPYLMVEIRNDLLQSQADIDSWATDIANFLDVKGIV